MDGLHTVQEFAGKYDVSFASMKNEPERWCHLREYHPECYQFTENGVKLFGNSHTLDDVDAPVFLGVRQSEFNTVLEVTLSGEAPEAGITFYLSEEHHYDLAVVCKEGGKSLILRFHIGDAEVVVSETKLPAAQEKVALKVVSDAVNYTFYGQCGDTQTELGSARTKYLSSEVAGGFTGVVMGMYAAAPQGNAELPAEFTDLLWKQGGTGL